MRVDGDPAVNGTAPDAGAEGERVKALNVCKALRCMTDLQSFTWEWNGVYREETTYGPYGSARKRVVVMPTSEPRFEDAILAEVARKPTLRHFGLSGPFGAHVSGLSLDNKFGYPVSAAMVARLCISAVLTVILGVASLQSQEPQPLRRHMAQRGQYSAIVHHAIAMPEPRGASSLFISSGYPINYRSRCRPLSFHSSSAICQ